MIVELELTIKLEQDEIAINDLFFDTKEILVYKPAKNSNLYFDFANENLTKNNIELVISKSNQSKMQIIKSYEKKYSWVRQSLSHAIKIKDNTPNIEEIKNFLKKQNKTIKICSLEPRCKFDFSRLAWRFKYYDNTDLLLLFDKGILQKNETQKKVNLLSIKLLSGNSKHLFELADKAIDLSYANAEFINSLNFYKKTDNLKINPVILKKNYDVETGFESSLKYIIESIKNIKLSNISTKKKLENIKENFEFLAHVLDVYSEFIPLAASESFHQELGYFLGKFNAVKKLNYLDSFLDQNTLNFEKLAEKEKIISFIKDTKEQLPSFLETYKLLESKKFTKFLLNIIRWAFEQQWRYYLVDKRKNLKKPLYYFAKNQLNFSWDILKKSYQENNLNAQNYINSYKEINSLMFSKKSFIYLFNENQDSSFNKSWLDIKKDTNELIGLSYLKNLKINNYLKNPQKFNKWLDRKQITILKALEKASLSALKMQKYWEK